MYGNRDDTMSDVGQCILFVEYIDDSVISLI